MSRRGLLAVSVPIAIGVVVLATTGCAPMNSTARFAATWKMHLDVALNQDQHRIRTDIADKPADLPAATAAYVEHLRRGERQGVLSTGTVRRLLDEMAAELRGTCEACVRMLERAAPARDVTSA